MNAPRFFSRTMVWITNTGYLTREVLPRAGMIWKSYGTVGSSVLPETPTQQARAPPGEHQGGGQEQSQTKAPEIPQLFQKEGGNPHI